jgi:hypothetical protein
MIRKSTKGLWFGYIYIIDDNDGGKDEGKGVSSVMGRRELLRTKKQVQEDSKAIPHGREKK